MELSTTSKERDVALRAVHTAARICARIQKNMVSAGSIKKKDRSPVTVADFAAQAVVCRILKQNFPDDLIVAEEDSLLLKDEKQRHLLDLVIDKVGEEFENVSAQDVFAWIDCGAGRGEGPSRFWTLDPVDGTKGFLRGDHYTVALALIVDGKVVMGILASPNLSLEGGLIQEGPGTMFWAVKGEGAWCTPMDQWDPRRISVSSVTDPSQMVFVESVAHADHGAHAEVAQLVGIRQPSIRIDSQVKYGILAAGLAQVYLRLPTKERPNYHEKIWDHAGGSILIEEAGGKVTDALGRVIDFSQGKKLLANRGLVVTSGVLHDRLIDILSDRIL